MKKGISLLFLTIFFITLVGSISATLCQGPDGYYDDCWKIQQSYNNYGSYYINSNANYNSNYNSIYTQGYMDSCRDSRGNYYPCYKQDYYNKDCDINDINCGSHVAYYSDQTNYNGYYSYSSSTVNYRDVYGNYVTETRPDYTRRYVNSCEDDWNLPWHLRTTNSNCYNSNNQHTNANVQPRQVVVYVR